MDQYTQNNEGKLPNLEDESKSLIFSMLVPTGDIFGFKKVTSADSSLDTYIIPRSRLKSVLKDEKQKERFHRAGIYFLFGEQEHELQNGVYVGRTNDASNRLGKHFEKSFWDIAIIFISNDSKFHPTHSIYLEGYCWEKLRIIQRFQIHNDQPITLPRVPEETLAEIGRFYIYIKNVLTVFGYPALVTIESEPKGRNYDQEIFTCQSNEKKVRALGIFVETGFKVLQGGTACRNIDVINSDYLRKERQELIENNILVEREDDGFYFFDQEHTFTSASRAARVILGYSASAEKVWKLEDGRKLKELQD